MASSEWWCVEDADGRPIVDSTNSTRLANQAAADTLASDTAATQGGPLKVVQYQRTEVTQYDRSVTVTTTAL